VDGIPGTFNQTDYIVMRILAIVVLLCFFTTRTMASDDTLDEITKGQPEDVQLLIERITDCNHWSGETPFDADRKREIILALRDIKCDRLPKDVAAARKRYANRPKVLDALEHAKEYSW
jgi:hypothetical protein